MDGIFGELGDIIAITEGVQAEGLEALESEHIENFAVSDGVSELDEVRVDETAEIMTDIFSEEVLLEWPEMSLDEKSDKLNEFYVKAGEQMGIETKGVIIEPMPSDSPFVTPLGYNSGDGYIHLNEDVVDDPTQLGQVLETSTHEMRHQFQSEVIANPEKFPDVSQDVIEEWDYEWKNYISPDYDYQGYYEQSIESDARDFSEDVLQVYTEKMGIN